MRTTCAAILSMFAMMGMLSPGMAQAAEIIILAGQGVVSAVRDVAPAFERASGNKVLVSFEVGPGLMNKVNSDAPADVVTHYPDMIDDLTKKGKVLAGTGVVIARAGIGVAVRAGAPIPDISSTDAFKRRSMLAASPLPIHALARAAGHCRRNEIQDQAGGRRAGRRSRGQRRSRNRDAADQRHSAGRWNPLRRPVAAETPGLRCFFGRGVGSFEAAGGGDCDGQVYVRTGSFTIH